MKPFQNVEDFAHYHGIIQFVGYGDHDRTDIENWIRGEYFEDVADILVEKLKKGKLEDRPRVKMYDWKDVIK